MKKVLIATGMGLDFESFIKQTALSCGYLVIEETVDVRKFLLDKVNEYHPQIVVISDRLMSDILDSQSDKKDDELLNLIHHIRVQEIRVIFVGVREEGDKFLSFLVNMNVFDIWHKKTFNMEEFKFRFLEENKITYKDVVYLQQMVTEAQQWVNPYLQGSKLGGPAIFESEKEQEQNQTQLTKETKSQSIFGNHWFTYLANPIKIKVPHMITLQPKLIAVASLYPGCGSTFLCGNLAHAISTVDIPVGVLEFPANQPILYEYLFGEANAPNQWIPWYKQILEKQTVSPETTWQQGQIYWVPNDPQSSEIGDLQSIYHLLMSVKQIPLVLVDLSHKWYHPFAKTLLQLCDEFWIVARPSPSRINIYWPQLMDVLKEDGEKCHIISNSWDPDMKKSHFKEWKESFVIDDGSTEPIILDVISKIPHFSNKKVMEAEWDGKFLFELKDCRGEVKEALLPLAKRLVPVEFHSKLLVNEKRGFFKFWKAEREEDK